MKAIVYTSNTGFTARYAAMLGEKTGLPVYTLKEACKKLEKKTPILYLGWLFASTVKGYGKAGSRFQVKALIAVGLCETGTLLDDVRRVNELPRSLPVFTVQGGMDHSRLRGINRFMIGSLIKFMSRAKNRTPEDTRKLQLIIEGGDFVCEENLAQFLAFYQGKANHEQADA